MRVQTERCAGRGRDPLQDQDAGQQQMDKYAFHDAEFTVSPSDRPVDQLITALDRDAPEPRKRKIWQHHELLPLFYIGGSNLLHRQFQRAPNEMGAHR